MSSKPTARPKFELSLWPKHLPELTAAQLSAREKFVLLWHEILPKRYSFVERFNHGYVAKLPIPAGSKTLEIGAGIGGHLEFEDLSRQEYHCLELRDEFCSRLQQIIPPNQVHCGSIEVRQPWEDRTFDRLVAVHVLEHLRDLPSALSEAHRLLKNDGCFDIVLPTEGGFAYTLARRISAQRVFEKNFGMDYTPIIRTEHVNTFGEVEWAVRQFFSIEKSAFFPLFAPIAEINLCVAFRLRKLARVPRFGGGSLASAA